MKIIFGRKHFEAKKKEKLITSILDDKEALSSVMASLGLELTDDKSHVAFKPQGFEAINYQPVNFDIFGENDSFLGWWKEAGYVEPKANEPARKKRYKDYEFMSSNSDIASLALETYVDESLATARSNEDFVKFEVMKDGKVDDSLSKEVTDELRQSGILTNVDGILEGMVTYGDHFVRVFLKDEKILLHTLTDPTKFERVDFPNTDIPKKFLLENKELYPWEVIHFKLITSDRRFLPYGKSGIERMRSSYKQLLINESLLALSRASKIERLIVRVPVAGTTPTAIFGKLMQSRSLIKNAIFGAPTSSSKSKSRPTALTEILFLPSNIKGEGSYDLDRIGSTIDITSVEDVEYFQDKLYNSSRMPRGYFKSDESYQGYRKLQLQDLKFSRFIIKIQKSFAVSCLYFAKIVLGVRKKWEEGMEIKAIYKLAAPMASEELSGMRDAVDTVTGFLSSITDVLGVDQVSNKLVIKALKSYVPSMTKEILDLIADIEPPKEYESTENSMTKGELQKILEIFSGVTYNSVSTNNYQSLFTTSKDNLKRLDEIKWETLGDEDWKILSEVKKEG